MNYLQTKGSYPVVEYPGGRYVADPDKLVSVATPKVNALGVADHKLLIHRLAYINTDHTRLRKPIEWSEASLVL